MWHSLHLISPISCLLTLPAFSLSLLLKSAQTLGRKKTKKNSRLVSLSVRSEQDFQIKPCHFASHWAPRPSMTSADSCAAVATSNLRLRKKGGGEEIGRGIKKFSRGIWNAGALQLQPSIISASTTFLFLSALFFPPFFFSHQLVL